MDRPGDPKIEKSQIADPEGYRAYATGSNLVSLSAFLQLVRLAKIAAARVPDLTVPTLVLASRDDTVASFAATERLLAGREEVRLIACDRATTSSPAITTASSSPPRSSPS